MKIVVPPSGEEQLRELRAVAPNAEIVPANSEALRSEIVDADGFYGSPSPELLGLAKRLRWIQYSGAGVESVLFPELVESDVILTNAKVIYGSHLADHIMAFVLAFNRNLPHLWRCQQAEHWESRANMRAMELGGETMLVVGLGGTGLGVARRAAAFDMRVLAVTRRPDAHRHLDIRKGRCGDEGGYGDEVSKETSPSSLPISTSPFSDVEVAPSEALHDLLPEADHIAVCCALTRETYHLFNDAAFARTKPTAYIHTVTRGGVIDPDALMRALNNGRLAGAGLDVTEPEPLPPGHPLWRMPNVLITPHSSGHSPHSGQRMFELLKENIRRFAAGEPLLNVVDKHAEY